MSEESDFLLTGRRMYMLTRPDGTYIVEKPRCCRRIFRETLLINSAPRFARLRTPVTEEAVWIRFKRSNAEKVGNAATKSHSLLEATEDTLDEVEKLLTSLNDGLSRAN
jgi:hypothetical protein